jgi:pentose-5-phosphate-3-epimerase
VLNPATSLASIEDALPYADYVLLMSVNPGFGGQKFISGTLDKVRRLRRMIDERKLPTRIEIDGGVDLKTSRGCCRRSRNCCRRISRFCHTIRHRPCAICKTPRHNSGGFERK